MFKPEEQQVEICLLKSHLTEIENDLVMQRSALPALSEENEQKYRATMEELKVTRSLNTEIERLKLENIRLNAKRTQLKRQSDNISKTLQKAHETRSELTKLLKQEEQETEIQIRQYEDSLEEIGNRFRKTHGYYARMSVFINILDEGKVNIELEEVNAKITSLEDELETRKSMVDKVKRQLDEIQPMVPEDLLKILGKEDLDEKIKYLTEKCDDLLQRRNIIVNKKNKLFF